jgi:hypothetical protein
MTHEANSGRTSLFRLIARRERRRPATVADPEQEGRRQSHLPPLILLSDNAAGPSVRRMTAFAGTAELCEHVDFWYPPEQRDRLIAFWALPAQPEDAGDMPEIEALVLVRDHRDAELVAPFSFVSMGDALAFVRDEIRHGLDPSLVVVLWAVPARVQTTVFGEVRVSPECPPDVDRPLQVLWNERSLPPAAPTPPPAPKSQVEELLGNLAAAMRSRQAEPRTVFAGFASPEGRF